MKTERIDIRMDKEEKRTLDALQNLLNCSRTDLIIKMCNYCLVKSEEFKEYEQ